MIDIFESKIWDWLDKATISSILENSSLENYSSWEIILMEWEENNWKWYIIKKWEVSVKKWDKILTILKEWEIFWEIWLLSDDPRNATIIANNELEVITINIESLFEIINNWNNKINKDIMKRIEENLKYVF